MPRSEAKRVARLPLADVAYKKKQCPAYAFKSSNGKAHVWFCLMEDGHEGEHRSYRRRWVDSPPDPQAQAHAERWMRSVGALGRDR
jgi:hypothetical protein